MGSPAKQGDSPVAEIVKKHETAPEYGGTRAVSYTHLDVYKRQSKTVSKLINNIMLDGKKGVAQNILYDAFKKVEEKTGNPAMERCV